MIARINAIFRRIDKIKEKGEIIEHEGLRININNYLAEVDGKEITLPRKEFELLAFFMSQPIKFC